MSESQITMELAEIILSVVNNPAHRGLKDRIVKQYHISRRMLTPRNLLRSSSTTFFRLMSALYENLPEKEFDKMLDDVKNKTKSFVDLDDGSLETLIKAHEGSPIKKQKKQLK